MNALESVVQEAMRRRADWLEDVIAGLLINGVRREEIEIREISDCTFVAVRGEPKYQFTLVVSQ